jgi:hypothetical protein
MRHNKTKWVRGIGAVVLAGGLWMTGSGTGVMPAGAQTSLPLPGVTQNWDKNLPSASRFTVLAKFNNQAVRDNNTGLVWEQAPDATLRKWQHFLTPLGATNYCVNKTVGGTVGWRLPSVVELASLIDPSLPAPFVPGTVFTGVLSDFYWSATTLAILPANAWVVTFGNFNANSSDKSNDYHAWCVRGGMNADQY